MVFILMIVLSLLWVSSERNTTANYFKREREKKRICWKDTQSLYVIEMEMSGKISIISPVPWSLVGISVLSFCTDEQNLEVVKTLEPLRIKSNFERKDTLSPTYPL